MSINPVETLNVFREDLQTELNKRSRSKELVRTRAPFLRFTTGADMSDLETRLGTRYSIYKGYRLFTLGLHGWDNLNYSTSDLYGTAANNGLVIGTTYNTGEQKLVYTHVQQDSSYTLANTGGRGTLPTLVTEGGRESNKNFPPPGITSARIERTRNGNVLKFTLEVSCYTQQQLELLDVVSFVPGMTAILEWGSVSTTPTGTKSLTKILDFKNNRDLQVIRDFNKTSRTKIIEEWCKPNNFNYDFSVARIANVKTTLENNVYKVTITAFGQADNIMYVSAYATNNPLTSGQTGNQDNTSINQYFKLNGKFSKLLHEIAALPPGDAKALAVLQFNDPDDVKAIKDALPTSQTLNVTNDLGFEDTFFIRFDFFIDYFINDVNDGLLKIVNSGIKPTDKLPFLINKAADTYIGFHKDLRSTQPATMIIYNLDKINKSNSNSRDYTLKTSVLSKIESGSASNRFNDVNAAAGTQVGGVNQVFSKLNASQFQSVGRVSDAIPLSSGVFVNSKAVQNAFLNARTWMDGFETLLRNMNSATENYWDLKLFYDDDVAGFRILDDNVRRPQDGNRTQPIYTFNKKLSSLDGDTIGPDVLNVEVKTDYPKAVFSQLAISALNNNVSSPERRETDFVRARVVDDIFSPTVEAQQARQTQPQAQVSAAATGATVSAFIDANLKQTQFSGLSSVVQNSLNEAGFGATNIPAPIESILKRLFANKNLLTTAEAAAINQELNTLNPKLTPQQLTALKKIFAARTVSLINNFKKDELDKFVSAYDTQASGGSTQSRARPGFAADATSTTGINKALFTDERKKKVVDKITQSQTNLLNIVNSKIR
jgi:hypothetical protein